MARDPNLGPVPGRGGPGRSRAGEPTPDRCWTVGCVAIAQPARYYLGGETDDLFGTFGVVENACGTYARATTII